MRTTKYMKRILSTLLLLVLLVLPLLSSTRVFAKASAVQDDAGLLEEAERNTLDSMIQRIADSSGLTVRIFTVDSLNGRNGTKYLDDLEDTLNLPNAVFILIDLSIDNTENRAYYINTFDDANTNYFNQKRRDAIRDAAISELKKGNYYEGLHVSLEMIETYSKTNPRTDSLLYQSWFQLLLCLLISGITVFYMAYTSGGKETTTFATYLKEEDSGLLGQYDHYLRTTVTRVKREREDHNSNTHTTSGGHSSGSSSGHF